MNIDYKLIGKRIKNIRLTCKITQEQLAEKLSVSVGYISQLERGVTKSNLEILAKLSVYLNCEITDFIGNTVVNKNEYLYCEFIDKFSLLKNNEKQIVIDLIESIICNRV